MPTSTDEISLFDKLYCIAIFEIFFPFSLQKAAAASHADCGWGGGDQLTLQKCNPSSSKQVLQAYPRYLR
jgi:hypothetical protein